MHHFNITLNTDSGGRTIVVNIEIDELDDVR